MRDRTYEQMFADWLALPKYIRTTFKAYKQQVSDTVPGDASDTQREKRDEARHAEQLNLGAAAMQPSPAGSEPSESAIDTPSNGQDRGM